MSLEGIRGRLAARRSSLAHRVEATAALVKEKPGPWLIWCGLNAEQDALATALDGESMVSVAGHQTTEEKKANILRFLRGDARIMLTKAKVAGFGLNFQHCRQMAFVGLSDSYESYFQCIRRCYRYGQQMPVHAYVIVSQGEQPIVTNVRRKEVEATTMARTLVEHMAEMEREELGTTKRQLLDYAPVKSLEVPTWL